MKRTWGSLLVLLGLQTALCGVLFVLEALRGCPGCRANGPSFALPGFLFYAALLALAVRRGPSRPLFGLLLFAAGVHAALTVRLISTGASCLPCLTATLLALVLAGLSVRMDPFNLGALALLLSASALLVAVWRGPLPSPAVPLRSASDAVRLVIYTQPECGYCDELRTRVIPEIQREFGPRLRVDYRPADEMPALRRTPTLILPSAQAGREDRIIEGLPTPEYLRTAILEAERRS